MEKKIKMLDLLFLSICNMVGIGVFSMAHYVLSQTGTCASSIFLIVASAIIATMFGLCYAELGSTYPYAGGDLNYLSKAYSKHLGTIYSLVSILLILPLSCAIMSIKIHECFENDIGRDYCIAALLGLCTIFLSFGGRLVTWTMRILFFLKVVTVASLLVISSISFIVVKSSPNPAILDVRNSTIEVDATSIVKGLCFTQFSFDGWNCGNYIANRIHNPGKSFPKAIVGSIWIVAFIYILISLSMMCVVPYDDIIGNVFFIDEYFKAVGIPITPRMLSIIVTLIPTIGSLVCSLIVGTGIIESLVPVKFSKKLEMVSLAAFSLIVFAFAKLESITWMVNKIAFGTSLFYSLSCMGLVFLKLRHPSLDRPFSLPLVVPLAASLIGISICSYIICCS
ncbi:L-type amino acid transporter [Encephalitozoon hellem ATCC 50504]|uniref:Amino acid transporter n=1 Tax=Encephalitozoon hellem TaxID=27973 RepID=A0A9Q9CCP9_ENCHE|nr:L-type amino acid transporter [Encephalitozoon hellem ATCC 50504]AFM98516.1 L-type amino acid transporter [Encephalitozoon hellem ATCC 50504]UTX43443.1 amino acid transporter [Encephalitozoon hellem]WEL38908.1 amino acid transporter [Encephalitozoon hellem]|eukprot:XP_003887497.1 L-type amino acid transporter [Encephalitozoon hellem ATCC 50504]